MSDIVSLPSVRENSMPDPFIPVVAASTSFVGTVALAAGVAPVPTSLPEWIPYLTTILGPALVFLAGRLLSAKAARDRSLAAAKERRAQELKADADPANDADAQRLLEEADALRAQADGLEALRPRKD